MNIARRRLSGWKRAGTVRGRHHSPRLSRGLRVPLRSSAAGDDLRREVSLPRRRTIILGAGEEAQTLAEELQNHFPSDYEIIGFVDDGFSAPGEWRAGSLGLRDQMAELIDHY